MGLSWFNLICFYNNQPQQKIHAIDKARQRAVPVTCVWQKNYTFVKYISGSARWSLRCKNTYNPTENVWQVQLIGKPLALFFFSREFKYFLILQKNTVGGEKLDVMLKKCEYEEVSWFNHTHQLSPTHLLIHCPAMGWQRETEEKSEKTPGLR